MWDDFIICRCQYKFSVSKTDFYYIQEFSEKNIPVEPSKEVLYQIWTTTEHRKCVKPFTKMLHATWNSLKSRKGAYKNSVKRGGGGALTKSRDGRLDKYYLFIGDFSDIFSTNMDQKRGGEGGGWRCLPPTYATGSESLKKSKIQL